jgi:cyanate lyase
MTPPLELRRLRAKMALKDLQFKDVADLSGVNPTYCSLILAGRRVDPENLAKIKKAIRNAPMPQEAAA